MSNEAFASHRAKRFRKRSEVLAFRSDDAITFHKSWGTQNVRAGGWVLVPVGSGGRPSGDVYGCDEEVFKNTYAPSPSGRDSAYIKTAEVSAYQPGYAFTTPTEIRDADGTTHLETEIESGGPTDWFVQNPGGETYVVSDEAFRETYVEVN